ncbi:MAG: ferritin family protein [Desulfobacterales bacterium]|nr:ferritin family protein [Desulfobacterales bacterium]
MSYDYNAKDILEMAIQIEKNGAVFYRNAAESLANTSHKQLLLDLAAMEDQHEKTFTDMKSNLSEEEKKSTAFDPDEEAGLYLKALADTRVFFEKEMPGGSPSMKDIFKEAILAEKDSIVFYLGMKDFVPEKFGKNRIEKIIKEEMGHIKLISNQLTSLKEYHIKYCFVHTFIQLFKD